MPPESNRPLLAFNWIERGLGVVPTQFAVLVDRLVTSPQLRQAVDSRLESKKAGEELDMGSRIDRR